MKSLVRIPRPGEPDFVHRYWHVKDHIHSCKSEHLIRHIAIDILLYRLYEPLYLLPCNMLWTLLRIPQILVFGVNCNYPLRDIALYLVWWLRGCGQTKEKLATDRVKALKGGRKWMLHLRAQRKSMLRRKCHAMLP